MTRLATAPLMLVLVPGLAAAALAGPRDERERITKDDAALARRAVARPTDLGAGWTRIPVPKQSNRCPSYNPDLSRFTLTGKAHSGFTHGGGAAIASSVSVYPNASQAAAAFSAEAKPGLMVCLSKTIVRQFAKSGVSAFVASKQMTSTPRIGARSAAFHIVFRLVVSGRAAAYRVDILTFEVHRAIGALSFQALGGPIRNQVGLARRVEARLATSR